MPVFLITSRNEVTGARIFPSPLDDAYLWAAVRYVERNLKITAGQVLPGIVEKELQIDINGLLNSDYLAKPIDDHLLRQLRRRCCSKHC